MLTSNRALALAELTIDQLLWNAVVRHADDVACPSDLGLAHDEDIILAELTPRRTPVSD